MTDPGPPPAAPDRPPLPRSTAGLPALGSDYQATLTQGLAELTLELPLPIQKALADHVRLLLAWTSAINLTAIRQPEAVAREHVLDSLAAVPLLRALGPARPAILDLGSGAGYPGLPLGLALPAARLGLLDSIAKKARFLSAAAEVVAADLQAAGLEPPPIEILAERAEAAARRPDEAGAWDIVAVRAVGPLDRLVGLAWPFLRPGGHLVAWKRDAGDGRLAAEIEAARPVITALRGAPPTVEPVTLAGLEDHRLVAVGRHPGPGRRTVGTAAHRLP
ncbi:MAG TPA: 16S rRNA (guanine(527)-N(7))-methyltransferase RsmG [Candidatus Limnocylindrales bacterium]|nr:16S rRNA (guanine(527)-N(7))-methyltransferase RsmG [Candidatus Limnocylindrales bacterium]